MPDNQVLRDAIFALAEIAGRDQPATLDSLRERCGLDPAPLKRAVALLSESGLIQRAEGRTHAYSPLNGTAAKPISEVVSLLSSRLPGGRAEAAADLGLGDLSAQVTVGQLSAALASVDASLCPCIDLCAALRGLDEQCDPFDGHCPTGLRDVHLSDRRTNRR